MEIFAPVSCNGGGTDIPAEGKQIESTAKHCKTGGTRCVFENTHIALLQLRTVQLCGRTLRAGSQLRTQLPSVR